MSDLIEINEGNCVLDVDDFNLICKCFDSHLHLCNMAQKNPPINKTTKLLQKIKKLNDLAKEGRGE